jgi:hypothetical protein
MGDGLIPSFKPQNLIKAKAPGQRQPLLISQRATGPNSNRTRSIQMG